MDNKQLEFYKWDGDLSQLLQNVREKLNEVAQVTHTHFRFTCSNGLLFFGLTFSFLCGTELVKRREESLFGGIRKIFQVLGTNPSLDNILVSKTSQLFLWNVANSTGAVLVVPRN